MAASGATPIILYHSTTPAAVPSASNLAPGELAINIADGKIYYEDDVGAVQSLSAGVEYIVKTANYTASANEGILADTSGGAFTVTLPATPATGDVVVVADPTGDWGTNNLTVGRNGETIAGVAQDLTCDISGVSVQLVYDGTTWAVYAQVGGNGGTAVTLNGVQTLTNKTISGASNTLTVDGTNEVGFRTTPINSQTADYTAVLADSGKTILHAISDDNARTFTIPANASVAYPVGTVISFVNLINTVTIAITSDTMYLANDGATGSRTLAAYGMATAMKVSTTAWIISGTGLT